MAKTVYTNQQVIDQIDSGSHWTTGGSTATAITYGIATSNSWFPSGYSEYAGWSALNAKQAAAASLAIELWDDLIGSSITASADPNTADIRFSNSSTGVSYAHAYYPGETGTDTYSWQQSQGSAWFNPAYTSLNDPDVGEYGFMAVLHEIGHTLGLNHPGIYNGGSPTYANDALYEQDTHMYTVMSYFDAANTGADWYAPNGWWNYAQTPMVHDVLAIQSAYGADFATRGGDTVYGFNSTAGNVVFDFAQNTAPVVTIWDGGGDDTIDLSGWNTSSQISLVAGSYSHGNAMTYNIAIAYGADIENASGGGGNDQITGNDLANTLLGYGGNDLINGGAGNDQLSGGDGSDVAVYSGNHADYSIDAIFGGFTVTDNVAADGDEGFDSLFGIETLRFSDGDFDPDSLVPVNNPHDFNGDGMSDLFWQNDNGQGAIWQMNGTTTIGGGLAGNNPGPTWNIQDTGDFNGDGNSDILWQNDNGQVAIWQMNGTTIAGGGFAGDNPGPTWNVQDTGDFNGDGNSDIVWQNDNGQAAVWFMDGNTVIGGGLAGDNPGLTWQIEGAGDFNNDGKSDLLWQDNTGQAAIWLMDGTTVIGGGLAGNNPGPDWQAQGSGDFNGDGNSDIVWQNDNGQAAVWFMNGNTVIGGGLAGSNPGSTWHIRDTGDYNDDGKFDFVWQNDSGQAAVWLMDGTTVIGGGLAGSNPGSDWMLFA